MREPNRSIWITGVGAVTPVGNDYSAIGEHLLAGVSGVRSVKGFDVSQHPSQIAAQIEAIPCPPGYDEPDFRRLPRLLQMSLASCTQALSDSGWWEQRQELRIGLVLGLGVEWLARWEEDNIAGGKQLQQVQERAEPVVHATARHLGLRGPAVSVAAACASGNYALAQARRWLELGWVDVCLAGACDASISPMGLAGFGNLRALSRRNHDPAGASRPFDQERDGFVVGEGGAMFVLETAERARCRSARVYGEVAGCGASSDAFNMVIPCPDPAPAAAAMNMALQDAGIHPEEVDYVNAHATSTPVGDAAEARVLEQVFGERVSRVPVSSTKSMTGHCLTAAAAIEALACLVALEKQALPPTINLENPDAECRLLHVANSAQKRRVRVTVSNSFGFGGSNTCLLLKAV